MRFLNAFLPFAAVGIPGFTAGIMALDKGIDKRSFCITLMIFMHA
jgi:hypothetical protein